MYKMVAKASSGLIPQLFLIRVLNKSKEQSTDTKKALRDWPKDFESVKQIDSNYSSGCMENIRIQQRQKKF